MADGIPCEHCGRSETCHIEGIDPDKILEGYNLSLRKCVEGGLGYLSEDPELSKKLERESKE